MALMPVPLALGQSEGVDPKVAPNGTIKSVVNCYLQKDGRLAKRRGFLPYGGTGAPLITGPSKLLSLADSRAMISGLTTKRDMHARSAASAINGNWEQISPAHHVLGVEEIPIKFSNQTEHSGCVYLDGYLAICYEDSTEGSVVVQVMDYATRQIIVLDEVATSNAEQPRLVTVGNYIVCMYRDTSANHVKIASFDTSATTIPGSFTNHGQATSSSVSSGQTYDVAPLDSSFFVYVEWNGTSRIVRKYAFNGIVGATDTTADANTQRPTIFAVSGSYVAVAWWLTGSGDVEFEWFDTSLTSVAGPTSFGLTDVVMVPGIGPRFSAEALVAVGRLSSGEYLSGFYIIDSAGSVSSTTFSRATQPASRPFDLGNGTLCLIVDEGDIDRAFYIKNLEGIQIHDGAFGRNLAVKATDQPLILTAPVAISGGVWAWAPQVIKRGDVTAATPTTGPGLFLLNATDEQTGQSAELDGLLYMSGTSLSVFDRMNWTEAGHLTSPEIDSVTPNTSGGSMADGSYAYVVTFEMELNGRIFRSAPSLPVTATVSGGSGNGSVDVILRRSIITMRRTLSSTAKQDVVPLVKAHVWRTVDSGTVYHRVTDDNGIDVTYANFNFKTHSDTLADASITSNAVVYTQVGNQLANSNPPTCRYLCRHGDRLVAAGLEDPYRWQASKFQTPAEGIHWADDNAFRGQIPEVVTGVFSLDDRLIVCSATGFYEVNGEGPDDSGQGAFLPPRKLPSDVGLHDARSLLELPTGEAFQANTTQMYLMPRGGGSPIPFGEPVEDTLQSFPVITSATLLETQNLAIWTCNNTAGTAGRLIVFDIRASQWFIWNVGTLPFYSSTDWGGELALLQSDSGNGGEPLIQGSGYSDTSNDSVETFVTQTVELTDLRPFGPSGWGRILSYFFLGEYRDDHVLSVRESVDSGQTYSTPTTWNINGLSAGDAIERKRVPAVRKTGTVRVELSATQYMSQVDSEGLVFNSLTFDAESVRGLRRLPSSQVA